MAYIYKSDARPVKAAPSYAKLAKLRMRADAGDPVAALKLAGYGAATERLAGHLVSAFAGKAEGGTLPGRSGKRARAELKAKRGAERRPALKDMLRADLHSPDPRVRLTAEKALKAL